MKHLLPAKFADEAICVVVAGAGGTGSQIVTGLARMHLALAALGHHGLQVYVYDPDIVTDANVGRQLFSPSDIGSFKAEVLVNRINCYFGLNWQAHPHKYGRGNNEALDYDGAPDVLIGCVDSAEARRGLLRTAYRYWLDLGNQERKGQVILGHPMEHEFKQLLHETEEDFSDDPEKKMDERNRTDKLLRERLPNVMELFPELLDPNMKEDDAPSCSLAEALGRQDLFINQTIATFGLQLLWQFIRKGGLDIQGYFVNLETGNVRTLPIDHMRPMPHHKWKRTRKPVRKTKKKKNERRRKSTKKPKAEPKPRARKFRGKVKIGDDLAATIASIKRSKRADLVKRIAKRKRAATTRRKKS